MNATHVSVTVEVKTSGADAAHRAEVIRSAAGKGRLDEPLRLLTSIVLAGQPGDWRCEVKAYEQGTRQRGAFANLWVDVDFVGADAAEAAAALRAMLEGGKYRDPLHMMLILVFGLHVTSVDAYDADGAADGPDMLDAGGGYRFTLDGRIVAPDGSMAGVAA
jgi:hypothetical protein